MLASALAMILPALVRAAPAAPDPVVGGWTLNVERSKFGTRPVPTSQLRTYTETPDGLEVIVKGESVDGEADVFESTFKYDGKDYPATGSPNFDTIAVRRQSPLLSRGVLKRAGRIVGHMSRVESKDGKTLTLTETFRDTKGRLVHEVLVYDRQL
jgi:hypothetical protein